MVSVMKQTVRFISTLLLLTNGTITTMLNLFLRLMVTQTEFKKAKVTLRQLTSVMKNTLPTISPFGKEANLENLPGIPLGVKADPVGI